MLDYDKFLMVESSIWWVVLSDSTNEFCAWEFLIGFQVCISILDTRHSTNPEVHDHAPCAIFLDRQYVNMHSIFLGTSVRAPRDYGLRYQSLYQIFLFLGY